MSKRVTEMDKKDNDLCHNDFLRTMLQPYFTDAQAERYFIKPKCQHYSHTSVKWITNQDEYTEWCSNNAVDLHSGDRQFNLIQDTGHPTEGSHDFPHSL